jgi:hypothetical protein
MEMTDTRPCTCAPDERPYPCQHQYALGLCRKAEIRSLRIELDRCIAQIVDLTKIRLEDELVHGNTMGRIAIALFGEQNNRGDEDCVAQAIKVVQERNSLRQHLHDEHERHVGTMDERDAALADLAAARELLRDIRAEGRITGDIAQRLIAALAHK